MTGMLILATENATAKRLAPEEVAPIVQNGFVYTIGYSAYDDARKIRTTFIEATDMNTGRGLWKAPIYQTKYDPAMETDAQDIFVTGFQPKGRKLLIENEHGRQFLLDLRTRKVQNL